MRKKICYMLLILVMFVSYLASPFVQQSTVIAASKQEQENGIEYVNKKLGFSLTIPKSWEGNYTIIEEDGLVRFLFTYEGKKNDAIPPLFSISYEPKKEDGWNKDLRWMGELTSKNDMGYYYYYDALHLYRDSIPPGEEQDTVLTIIGQISEVLDSFKILESKGGMSGEEKPKEEETKKEKANGIEYVNKKLEFSLTLPELWKDHYIIKEDKDKVTFVFKYKNKVYDDIPLFTIGYTEDWEAIEISLEYIGLLGTKKDMDIYYSYLAINDDAVQSEEGRKIALDMANQVYNDDIFDTFKILEEEGATAEETNPKEEELERSSAEEAKPSNIQPSIDYASINHNKSITLEYVNKKLGYTIFSSYGSADLSPVSAGLAGFVEEAAKLAVLQEWQVSEQVEFKTVQEQTIAGDYFNRIDLMLPGTILITPVSGHKGMSTFHRFGHSAIVDTSGLNVIEAVGPGEKSKTTPLKDWINDNPFWTAYVVIGATLDQYYSAANWAEKNAIGVDYSNFPEGFLYDKWDTDTFYCSSLVWRAWYEGSNQTIDIDYDDGERAIDVPILELMVAGVLDILDPNSGKQDTVFPAEIAIDEELVPIAKSEENKVQDPFSEGHVFYNDRGTISLFESQIVNGNIVEGRIDDDTPIIQVPGKIYKVKVLKIQDNVKLQLENKSGDVLKKFDLTPENVNTELHVDSPAGSHAWRALCSDGKECNFKASIRSEFKY
ncbi:hypothetical protein ACFRH9_02725 [Peribacillus butanolivorans]|uniref:hypothetical protein n=1 Tax=Peribacillus butanolivorans TaxID=421767 RepID=UPI00366C80EF